MAKDIKLKFIGSHIPPDLYKKLEKSSESSGRSISKELLFILKEHVNSGAK